MEGNLGDEVWGCSSNANSGTHAEFVCIDLDEITHKPSSLDHLQAASLPYVAQTTWSAIIRWAGLRPQDLAGKKVFIQGGAGGVGCFSIQLFKSMGCEVATTCSEKNIKLVKSLGADRVIDYNKSNFEEVLSDYDIVSINNFDPSFKIDSKLKQDTLPAWALQNNLLSIKVIFFKTADFNQSVDQIRRFTNLPILENELFNSIELSITPSDLSLVSSLSFISYIEPVDPPAYKENDLGRTLHRTNVINTEYVTGKKYNGEVVKVMMHDDGYV